MFLSRITRNASTRTFEEYRETEASLTETSRAVTNEGDLLDYETLELRVHPPNIRIKIEETATLITLDSANRPGTLIEVVQCLTDLGLSFMKARITSDGGWFVDEFYVTDSDGPLTDAKKIKTIEKVLNINLEVDEAMLTEAGIDRGPCRIIELVGEDRPGLLADITKTLSHTACDAWSASIWTNQNRETNQNRATFVLGVNDARFPLHDPTNWRTLRARLQQVMRGETAHTALTGRKTVHTIVQLSAVVRHSLQKKHVGHVHHERRLHRLMMKDELRLFEEDHASEQGPTESACDGRTSSSGTLTAASISASRSVVGCMALASASSGPGNSSGRFGGKEEELPNVHVTLEDANPSQHKIEVSSCLPYRNYWFVRIGCCDRLKLLFDLVCTFVDLDYDVYHASLDTDAGAAIVEFYIRPRLGSAEFDEAKGLCLAKMLKHAIFRRVPKGLPIRMVTPGPGLRQHGGVMQELDMATLTKELTEIGLVITRATVKPCRSQRGHTEHVMYIDSIQPELPVNVNALQEACRRSGLLQHDAGSLPPDLGLMGGVVPGTSLGSVSQATRMHLARSWFAMVEPGEEWGVGSAGSSSSAQSRAGR